MATELEQALGGAKIDMTPIGIKLPGDVPSKPELLDSPMTSGQEQTPVTGTGGQPAVITSEPVVKKAESNMKSLDSMTQSAMPTTESVMREMAAKGEGKITDSPEGPRFINKKGDIYDFNGNIVGNANEQKKNESSGITEALGGTTLKEGEKEIYAPNGVKLIIDKDGIIRSSDASSLAGKGIANEYLAGTSVNDYSNLASIPGIKKEEEVDSEYQDMKDKMSNLYDTADATSKEIIASIQAMTDSAVAAQQEANRASEGATSVIGITSGRSRYAPDLQQGIMKAQVSAGISKIADLKAKGLQLIAQAKQARDEGQFKILDKMMSEYQTNKKQMFEQTVETQRLAMDMEKNAIENKKTAFENLKLARENSQLEALNFVPAIIGNLETMSPEEQMTYLNKTAEESGGLFDAVTLKNAVDTYQRQLKTEAAKGISSYMADWNSLGGLRGTGKTFQQFYKEQQTAEQKPTTGGLLSEVLSKMSVSPSIGDAAGRISGKLTAKGSDTFENLLANQIARGDINAVKETLMTSAIDTLPAADQTSTMGRVVTLDLLDSIESDLKAYTKAKGDTNIFKGTAEQVANKIGTTTDPKLAYLATKINTAIQIYRQALSGAAFTVPETKEYKAIFPNIDSTGELNLARIQSLRDTYRTAITSKIGVAMGSNSYKQIFGSDGAFAGSSGELNIEQEPRVRVKLKSSGETGSIPASEYDESLYEKL